MADDSNTDKNYEKKPDTEDSPKDKTIDKSKEELENNNKKTDSVEERIDNKQKTGVLVNYKSKRKTRVLSVVVGFFGVMGLGHIYLGRLRRGILILIIVPLSWVMIMISYMILGLTEPEEQVLIDGVLVIGQISLAVMMGHIVLFIWQIRNSGKLCKEYNECLEQHGQPPW